MILSNLLDKTVLYGDTKAKICAVYEKNQSIWLGLECYDGELIFGVLPIQVRMDTKGHYKVYLFHSYQNKIRAIKIYREFTGASLLDAKNKIEAFPGKVLLSENLTYEESQNLVSKIRAQNMEADIDG
jgi:hypothetical protein